MTVCNVCYNESVSLTCYFLTLVEEEIKQIFSHSSCLLLSQYSNDWLNWLLWQWNFILVDVHACLVGPLRRASI